MNLALVAPETKKALQFARLYPKQAFSVSYSTKVA